MKRLATLVALTIIGYCVGVLPANAAATDYVVTIAPQPAGADCNGGYPIFDKYGTSPDLPAPVTLTFTNQDTSCTVVLNVSGSGVVSVPPSSSISVALNTPGDYGYASGPHPGVGGDQSQGVVVVVPPPPPPSPVAVATTAAPVAPAPVASVSPATVTTVTTLATVAPTVAATQTAVVVSPTPTVAPSTAAPVVAITTVDKSTPDQGSSTPVFLLVLTCLAAAGVGVAFGYAVLWRKQ